MGLKPPDNMSAADFLACARHWYECKGCDLCNPLRERLQQEDQRVVAVVQAFVEYIAKRAFNEKG